MKRAEVLSDANFILGNSTRFELIKLLTKGGLGVSEMAERLNTDRSTICYHLGRLEDHGFITGEYQIIRRPKNGHGLAKRIFKATEKVGQVMVDVDDILGELKKEIGL